MQARISTNSVTNDLTITIRDVNWEDIQNAPFYEGECQVRALRQLLGQKLTAHLLQSKDVSAPSLELEGQSYYRKEASPGHYQTLYGEVVVSRHLSQTSAGGTTLCPLESNCQLSFGSATPLWAEGISFTRASQRAGAVEQDLAQSHGVALSDTYLRHLAQQVGQIALDKRAAWHLQRARPRLPPSPSSRWAVMAPRCRWLARTIRRRCAGPSRSMTRKGHGCTLSTWDDAGGGQGHLP